MAMAPTLFWHRRDLRLADNTGLHAAVALGPAVTGVVVLDPAILTPPELAADGAGPAVVSGGEPD